MPHEAPGSEESDRDARLGAEFISHNVRLDGTEAEFTTSLSAMIEECRKIPSIFRSVMRGALLLAAPLDATNPRRARLMRVAEGAAKEGGLPWVAR